MRKRMGGLAQHSAESLLGGARRFTGELRPSMLDSRRFGRADEFLPERWSSGHEVQPRDSKTYAQFGAGPRVCPGRYLAGVEMRLVLFMLSLNFSMELATSPGSIKEIAAFTMMPNPMPVRLESLHLSRGCQLKLFPTHFP